MTSDGSQNKGFITFHIINSIPWSNLNRDDSGTPKRTVLGGVQRGMLSSQSIKRAIRKDFENRILDILPHRMNEVASHGDMLGSDLIAADGSVRSRYLAEWAVKRAEKIAAETGVHFNSHKASKVAGELIKKLVGGEDNVLWLSVEELEALAAFLVADQTVTADSLDEIIPQNKKTGALAIAAFGRMFASAQHKQTDAAIAVSPAISTHENIIETDYFITGDDYGFFKKDKGVTQENFEGAGAGHLGTALYTSGVFYRTVTIDIRELKRNWTGITSDDAKVLINQLIRSIIFSLPTGKKNHTAPYETLPLLVVEQQSYREAISIADPVLPKETGGFITPTIEMVQKQLNLARRFNGSNYGEALVTGQYGFNGENESTVEEIINSVASWIFDYNPVNSNY